MAGILETGSALQRAGLATLADVAGQETNRINFNRKIDAQEKAGMGNAAGTALGMGYTAYKSGLMAGAGEAIKGFFGGGEAALPTTAAAAPAASSVFPAGQIAGAPVSAGALPYSATAAMSPTATAGGAGLAATGTGAGVGAAATGTAGAGSAGAAGAAAGAGEAAGLGSALMSGAYAVGNAAGAAWTALLALL